MTPNALAFDTKVSDKAVRLYMALEDFSGTHRACWPGYDTIGDKIGCTGRWVAELVKELVAAGWLLVEFRQGKSNKYTLLGRVPRKEPTHELPQKAPMKSYSYKPYPTNNNQGGRGFKPNNKGLDFNKLARWQNKEDTRHYKTL